MDKTVQVRNLVIGEGRPKICIPVMGSTTETLKEAAGHAMKKHPDLIEWSGLFCGYRERRSTQTGI